VQVMSATWTIWYGWRQSGRVRDGRATARSFAGEKLRLDIKTSKIGRRLGVVFCGFHIGPDRSLLSHGRNRRYVEIRKFWEQACADRQADGLRLQAGWGGPRQRCACRCCRLAPRKTRATAG
jgi:hypothetical protein